MTSKRLGNRRGKSLELQRVKIGMKLRQLRRLKRLRLKDLALQVGLSESLLSKIENDKANPSSATLKKLTDALDTSVDYLFAADDSIVIPVGRRGKRPVIDSAAYGRGQGIKMERLIPYSKEHLLQANIHIVAPGGRTHGPISHSGEEMGLVLEGRLQLRIGGRTYRLQAGDSFHFRSELPHSYRNAGRTTIRMLWVNTPPAYYLRPTTRLRNC